MQKGLVSVVIPTFRRPDKLDRAIDSVLAQTYSEVEVIVVDDNDPDTEGRKLTEELMLKYEHEPRVKYIKHERNKNGSAARNTGARNSDAEYVAFLDDDDVFYPQKIESQVNVLSRKDSSWGCCYSKFVVEKPNGVTLVSRERREGNLRLDALMREFHIASGSNLLIRKEAFESINGFDESFIRNQDIEFLSRMLESFKIAYSEVLGLKVYLHNNHSQYNGEEVTNQYLERFKSFIDKLNKNERKTFFKHINRQRLYYFLFTKKNYSKCREMIHNGDSTLGDLFSVIWLRIRKGSLLIVATIRSRFCKK